MGSPDLAARRAIAEASLPQELARTLHPLQISPGGGRLPLSGKALPRGTLVEVVGRRSSGRFALALAALAAATSAGESAALVDLGDHLDPQGAAAEGVELARLLWVRPQTLKEALASAELLLGAGFALVVVDLGVAFRTGGNRHMSVPPAVHDRADSGGPNPGPSGYAGASRRSKIRRVRVEAAWIRLARRAKAHEAALLVLTPYRASGTAAGAVLTVRAARALWTSAAEADDVHARTRPLLAGLETRLFVDKARGESPGARQSLTLKVPSLVSEFVPGGTDTCRSPRNPPPVTQALRAVSEFVPGGADTCRSPLRGSASAQPPPVTQALRAAGIDASGAPGASLLDERRVGHA
ncbi:MAG TPA: hypothetical protein VKF32_02130 [Thermoanaerobaculia bacterium]|nr:hypothetical protein [Thermoanaerobaculia bacterium]